MEKTHHMQNEILYQIYVRTFSPEGTLARATALLDHVAASGATVAYLAPVVEMDEDTNPENWSDRQKAFGYGNPKNAYRMKDYFHVDPEYGTDADLRAFIARAHELGLKVMMDLVYLHCGPKAPMLYAHRDFCEWDAGGRPKNAAWHFPKLNYASAALREYLWGNMVYFVKDLHVDGFRCDVGDQIPLDFWQEGVRRVRAIHPNVMMLDEGRPDNYLDAFDTNYGWDWSWMARPIVKGEKTADEIRAQLQNDVQGMAGRITRFSDSHDYASDDGDTRLEKQAVSPAATDAVMMLNFLLPGVPFLYNGQEFADAHNCNMFTNRFFHPGNCVDWSMLQTARGKQRFALVQALSALKKSHPALHSAASCDFPADGNTDALLTFVRASGSDRLRVTVNLGKTDATVPPAGDVLLQNACCGATLAPFGWMICRG